MADTDAEEAEAEDVEEALDDLQAAEEEAAEEDGDPPSEGPEEATLGADDRAEPPSGIESIAQEVEASSGAGTDSEDADEDEGTDEEDSGPSMGESMGEMYVDTLAVVLAATAEEFGDGEPGMDAEAIGALATGAPIELDQQVDRLVEEMGGPSELSPGQAVAVSTGLLVVLVLVKETDVAANGLSAARTKFEEANN